MQKARASIIATSFAAGPVDVQIGQRIRVGVTIRNNTSSPCPAQIKVVYYTHDTAVSVPPYDAQSVAISISPLGTVGVEATTGVITSGFFAGTDIDAMIDLINPNTNAFLDRVTVLHAVRIVSVAPPPPPPATPSADIVGEPTFSAI